MIRSAIIYLFLLVGVGAAPPLHEAMRRPAGAETSPRPPQPTGQPVSEMAARRTVNLPPATTPRGPLYFLSNKPR